MCIDERQCSITLQCSQHSKAYILPNPPTYPPNPKYLVQQAARTGRKSQQSESASDIYPPYAAVFGPLWQRFFLRSNVQAPPTLWGAKKTERQNRASFRTTHQILLPASQPPRTNFMQQLLLPPRRHLPPPPLPPPRPPHSPPPLRRPS